jgi:hypothetical protein
MRYLGNKLPTRFLGCAHQFSVDYLCDPAQLSLLPLADLQKPTSHMIRFPLIVEAGNHNKEKKGLASAFTNGMTFHRCMAIDAGHI